ncbi:MAG: oxidoreductase [Lysobacteraceae bacterium]|nr:MAG: oxidoreductase [Xanthomonadaceae bacterium]
MRFRTWQAPLVPAIASYAVVAAAVPAATWWSTATLSLACGVAALALMATAAILAARWPLVEGAFGGLDRVYLAHKWIGIWALGLASVHLVLKAGMPAWQAAAIVALPPGATRFVRQLSYVALMFIVVLALNRNIPYGRWRGWHKTSGLLFLVVVAHASSIKSPITLASPAGTWIAVLCALGIGAALYKLLLYPLFARHAAYRVIAVSASDNTLHMTLAPVREPIAFAEGQFGFLRMNEQGLREPHPFTIANGRSADGHVEFVIRALGDYTNTLVQSTRPGMVADIYAPYGRFRRRTGAVREAWIGGGVGISPFIAWLKDPEATGFERVTLFYFYTPGREFPAVDVLQQMAHARGAEFVAVAGGPLDPRFTHRFAQLARDAGPDGIDIAACGPAGLLDAVRRQMREQRIPESRLQHEYFSFR